MIEVVAAREAELDDLLELLGAADLPTAGFARHLGTALVARDGERLVGCVALEPYGDEALLRSLVVAPAARGTRVGERLTAVVLELARRRGARRVWLLTTTAERFFPRFGFERVERSTLPPALDASAELRGASPASAVAMRLDLDAASPAPGGETP